MAGFSPFAAPSTRRTGTEPARAPEPRLTRAVESTCVALAAIAFAGIQVFIGGERLLFSLPAFAVIGFAGVLSFLMLRAARPPADRLCLVTAGIFFGYVLARAWFSPVEYIARADIYSVLGGLLVYGLFAFFVTDARIRISFVALLLLFAVAHVVIGAVQFRDGTNFMPIDFLQRFDYGPRASGFYVCPNHLAGLLEVLGVFALSIACWSRWPFWGRLIVGYLAVLCYGGLLITGSRGGYLSGLAGMAVFAFLSLLVLRRAGAGWSWKVGSAGAVAAVIGAVTLALALQRSDILAQRAGSILERDNPRLDLWEAAVQQWQLQPLIGTGSGTYLYYGRQFRTERMQMDPVEVHNDYLHLLAEYGLLGGLGAIVFVGVHVRRGVRSYQRLGPRRVAVSDRPTSNALALNIAALASVAAYAVHSVVDFNLHIPANVLLLAFVFALLANAGVPREHSPPRLPRGQLFWRISVPLLGIFVVVQAARLLPGEYYLEKARVAVRDLQPGPAALFALRGLQSERENPFLFYQLGAARVLAGDSMREKEAAESFYRSAAEAFAEARRLAPRDQTFALELAFVRDKLGEFDRADELYRAALALDPRSISVRRYYEGRRQPAPP